MGLLRWPVACLLRQRRRPAPSRLRSNSTDRFQESSMTSSDSRSKKSLISFGVAALMAVGAATAQVATIDASGSYQQEVQACMSGQTQQSRDDCLKEARNANADKRRGVLDTQGSLEANAMTRCNVFTTGEDRAACQARMMG